MDGIQVKATYRQTNYIWDGGSRDLPMGFLKEFNDKFRAWEERRGLAQTTSFGSTLRGAAKRSRKSSKKVSDTN